MADRDVWHVIAYGLEMTENHVQYDGWRVKKEGAEKAAKRFPVPKYQKTDAKDYAERMAKRNEPSQVIYHKIPQIGKNKNPIHPIAGEKTFGDDPSDIEG